MGHLGLVMCLAFGFILFGKEIVFYLFGADFLPALVIIPFSAVTLILNYANSLMAIFINIQGRAKVIAMTSFVSLIINAGLNFPLIPYFESLYGVAGAGVGGALTTNISELSVFVCLLYVTGISNFGLRNIVRLTIVLALAVTAHFFKADLIEMTFYKRCIVFLVSASILPFTMGSLKARDLRFIWEKLSQRIRK